MKDKYGDADLDSDLESSDSDEDEDAKELTEKVERDFFKTLSMIKSRKPEIYDKSKGDFFEANDSTTTTSDEEKTEKKSDKQKKKKTLLKDLEREMVLKKLEKFEKGEDIDYDESEEEIENESANASSKDKKSYYEEQEDIKKRLAL